MWNGDTKYYYDKLWIKTFTVCRSEILAYLHMFASLLYKAYVDTQ